MGLNNFYTESPLSLCKKATHSTAPSITWLTSYTKTHTHALFFFSKSILCKYSMQPGQFRGEEVWLCRVKRGGKKESPINYDLILNFSLRLMSSIPAK